MNRNDYPLPHVHPIEDWRQVPIHENKEELVSIQSIEHGLLIVNPKYHELGIPGALNDCYVRREVAIQLVEAARKLPNGFKLMVWDGWRPFSVQKQLYDSYLDKLTNDYPEWSEERLHEGARQFVSYPTDDEKAPSPHFTGGSVDITIVDNNGSVLPMGTDFDDFGEHAYTRYYEEKKKQETLSEEEETYLQNRRLLHHIMTTSGFTNYSAEWWHFDHGNQWWAKQRKEPAAKYGLVKLEI